MSPTRYLQFKDKLLPKHLSHHPAQRRKDIIRRQLLEDSPNDLIQKTKQKYMRPIGEIEAIMLNFDS
jgi:hypothetical protein